MGGFSEPVAGWPPDGGVSPTSEERRILGVLYDWLKEDHSEK